LRSSADLQLYYSELQTGALIILIFANFCSNLATVLFFLFLLRFKCAEQYHVIAFIVFKVVLITTNFFVCSDWITGEW